MGGSIRARKAKLRGAAVAWLALFALPLLAACGNCDDEIAAASDFLADAKNLVCATDADCVAVSTGCHTFEGGFCSQSAVNRAAADSKEWRDLAEGLRDCESGSCAVCDGLLVPSCVDGVCGRAR